MMNTENIELTIYDIHKRWFCFEPKEESRAAKRKYDYDRATVLRLLKDGIASGELKHRIDSEELANDRTIDIFIVGTDSDGRGTLTPDSTCPRRALERCSYILPDDLAQFLKSKNKWPPSDSPLVTDWLLSEKTITEAETVGNNEPPRKIKEIIRNRSLCRDFIHELWDDETIEYEEKSSAELAWALLVSGKFKSKLIEKPPDTANRLIKFLDGSNKTFSEFRRCFNREFE